MKVRQCSKDKYVSYEEGLSGHVYSDADMHALYACEVNKTEYPDYETWIFDMLKSGVFERY